MTISEIFKYITTNIKNIYDERERYSIAKLLMEDIFGISSVELINELNGYSSRIINDDDIKRIENVVSQLKEYRPIQYVLGHTLFYGLYFIVNENVLIPRQETEELVDIVIKENYGKNRLRIIDIGTGSGCIAISIAKNINDSLITGTDISEKAIETSKINAKKNNVNNVEFILDDIFNSNISNKYDIIISNPPYLTDDDKQYMMNNVLKYEPHIALFVDNNDPLMFYKAIISFARNNLLKNGVLYFEINERYGEAIRQMLECYMFIDINIIKDINNKDRFVKCKLK